MLAYDQWFILGYYHQNASCLQNTKTVEHVVSIRSRYKEKYDDIDFEHVHSGVPKIFSFFRFDFEEFFFLSNPFLKCTIFQWYCKLKWNEKLFLNVHTLLL